MRQGPSGRREGELERPGDGVRQPLDRLRRPVSLLDHRPDSLLVSLHRPDSLLYSLLYSLLHQRPDSLLELELGYEGRHNLIRCVFLRGL
jgi:hypothetical protein